MLRNFLFVRPSIFIKTLIFLIIFLFIDYQSVAQSQGAPESMNYQAVIRDGSGSIVASQSVGIRIDVLQGSATGTSVYKETFTTNTNAYGSIAIQIGTGTVVSGTFSSIDWGANSYFVETAVDIDGTANGTSYVVISTTQLMSVPYALYAKSAGNSPADNDWTESGSDIYRSTGNVGIGTTSPAVKLEVSGQARITGLSHTSTMTNRIVTASSDGDLGTGNSGAPLSSPSLSHTSTITNRIVTASSDGDLGTGSINSPISSPSLAGTGDRMVVANANGDLSTQAIPSSSSNSHYIGESFGGGIVFFVYDNGQHGLIAATLDQSSGVIWGHNINVSMARADGVLAGLKNTPIIISIAAGSSGSALAATLCNEHSATVSGVTYGDWYLPSKYELNLLYLQKNLVGGFSNDNYWTSTESGSTYAWLQNMGDGIQYNHLKNNTYRVRAIRAF